MLLLGNSGMRNCDMNNVIGSVTGPSIDGMYGIAVINQATGRKAVIIHFLTQQSDAERLTEILNEEQKSISEFCHAVLGGNLKETI